MTFLQQLGIQTENFGASGGEAWWSTTTQSQPLGSLNPANGEVISHVHRCSVEDYETVIQQAELAADKWRQVPAPQRGELIRHMANILRENKDALGSLVSMEMGKSKQEGDGEVQEMIDIADFAVGQSRMMYGKTMHSERPQHRMYEQWHPYGVVGVISAFNFPVAVWAWNAFVAAVCGNVTVWKPSSKTPLCAIAVQKLCQQVMQQTGHHGVFSFFVPESHDIADKFIRDKRVALISFTGSTATGKHVAKVVAERLGSTILELGGNNAIIVDETADLSLAIPAIVFGAVGTAGQRCTSTRRVIIHDSIFQQVVESLQNAYQQISIGDPLDQNNLMGPLIDEKAITDYEMAVAECLEQGAEILCGGKTLEQPGFFVEPTLVLAHNEWPIVQRETFAPILYLMSYQTLEEAITLQNSVSQGLSSAIFTRDLQVAENFLSAMGSDCGIANVNIGTSGAEIGGAFGGEKETGGGRESGSDAWKGYMRRQTNTINWSNDLPLAQGIEFKLN